nr:hypothetical protein [Tanacetum cinerariifolium]
MSNHIPFEIQEQIIQKLPVKSLIKSRSISKPWKSLIDSSKFIADYNVCEAKPKCLFINYKEDDDQYYDDNPNQFISIIDDDSFPQHKFAVPLPIPVNSRKDFGLIEVVGSSHGLICFYGIDHDAATMMTINWNLSIRKSVGFHVPNLYIEPYRTIIGFGVCPHTIDPKFIKIPHSMALAPNMDRIRIHLEELKIFALAHVPGDVHTAIYHVHRLDLKKSIISEEFGEVHLPESLVENEFVEKDLSCLPILMDL